MWEGVFKYVHFIIKGSGGVKMLEVLVYIQNDSQKLVELIIVEVDVNTFLFKKQNKKIFFLIFISFYPLTIYFCHDFAKINSKNR